ncbi:SDR family oxidoreductase [Gilvimarinus sp. F26214L]|uniref:SDR family oxidoreductase n=1 Tax=Gilvimarinus sp. DZF01 TaxID=3461371 RepID=UPI00404549E7
MKIKGKTVVVTGGASGIGRGLVERFKQEGAANIVIADINRDELEEFASEVGGTAHLCDVSKEDEVKGLIEFTEKTFGQIDLYCGNAGIIAKGGVETPNETWERMWAVNVMAHVYATRHALPAMLERGEGYFLITASAAGLLSQIGSATYSVTKHAALALAEWVQITHGAQGIKVSALCPQAVESKMTADTKGGGVAGQDGMLTAAQVADVVMEGLDEERFMILPHPEVAKYFQNKASDYQRWLRGMQRLQEQFGKMPGGGLSNTD